MTTFTFRKLSIRGALITSILLVSSIRADVGGDNPTGTSGQFSGNITTACSYSPYTANVTRSTTDISVAGGVGTYPLAFTRTMNSRYTVGSSNTPAFGQAGTWTHSYQWSIDNASVISNNVLAKPTSYSLNYPDGRRVIFSTANQGTDPYLRGPAGVRDRFQVPAGNTNPNFYVRLPDGGQIWFQGYSDGGTGPDGGPYLITWTFSLMGIIDPYGQTTTVTYPADHSLTITEPAGRMLKIFYKTGPANDTVVDRVEEWMTSTLKTRTVTYNYSLYTASGTNYSSLTSVTYPDTTTATYTYQNSNIIANGRPLIKTCLDPMYTGPMWKIAYAFVPNATGVVYGQLQSENYFDGINVGAAVSSLSVTGTSTRTETRGDGPTRTFTYTGYKLTSATDFKNVGASQAYDTAGFVNAATDRNGHTTNFTNNAWTGKIKVTTYPLTAGDTPANTPRGTTTATYGWATCPDPNNRDANNPYYLYSGTDEAGNSGTFMRDSNKRITQINYPDSGSESFQYNSFGQVTSHTMKTGGIEAFTYDARGLKQTYRNPDNPTGNPTASYQYDSFDRVSGVTDALGSAGDINHTTNFSYNLRGQLLITTHPVDPTDGQRHTITSTYNTDGTRATVTDELTHVASSTYDDYRRPLTVTTPGHNCAASPGIGIVGC
jgi:YD repeat-containing protein